jgi:hypothetical protein
MAGEFDNITETKIAEILVVYRGRGLIQKWKDDSGNPGF